jgi:hypothetical protein
MVRASARREIRESTPNPDARARARPIPTPATSDYADVTGALAPLLEGAAVECHWRGAWVPGTLTNVTGAVAMKDTDPPASETSKIVVRADVKYGDADAMSHTLVFSQTSHAFRAELQGVEHFGRMRANICFPEDSFAELQRLLQLE